MKDLGSTLALAQSSKETRNGILIFPTSGAKEGSDLAKTLLYEIADRKTVLFLSGGKTPEYLYSELARERTLKIGSAAMVDERYGKPGHANSNELMIKRTGMLDYFEQLNIPFYPVLKEDLSIEDTASQYELTLKNLFSHYAQSVAILGIGEDGHIAGIAPNRADFIDPLFSPEHSNLLVSYFIDPRPMSNTGDSMPPHGFGKRITMTFKGLSLIDVLIILIFGVNKKAALSGIFADGPIEKVPSRFITNQDISRKTVIITDQKM